MFRDQQVDGAHAALEVRSNGGDVDQESVGRCRSYAQHGSAAHQKRADVHGAFTGRGHPVLVGFYDLLDGVNKDGFGNRGHLEAVRSALHSSGVFLGSEEDDAFL